MVERLWRKPFGAFIVVGAVLSVFVAAGWIVSLTQRNAHRYAADYQVLRVSRSVVVTHTYCQWDGAHVEIHMRVDDGGAPVRLTIQPRYWTASGEHGDSVLSGALFDGRLVPTGESTLTVDAGVPEGVKEDAPIERCSPLISA